ncbi:MAG: TonB-dependent receptor, partial [candidate division KSB1 bacterium]|nr:TonB-dependent receptor [candidate division KSB1 bacterium]
MQTKRFSSCLWALFMSGVTAAAFAQQAVLSGIVRDINTYREIRGVNIYIKNTNLGTSSDYTGKYTLIVPGANPAMIVVFRHIGYEPRELSIDSVRAMQYVELQPRIIPLPGVVVEEKSIQRLEIAKDLPQTVSVIDAKSFEIRGYVDAGDLLKTDHSVQVEEELSGKKTAAIRGGNPDEVVVLYNGIKMNSNYDNIFDLSLIDLEDIERFEIIKGSNTALYGPEAFSGVINVVPKIQQDYNIRFQQRVGTYRSGNWGLHLYEKLNRLHGSYSFKQGKTKRNFVDQPQGADGLVNSSLHHTASLNYAFSEHADGSPANALGGMYMYTSLDYENHRDVERLSNLNHLLSFKYTGDLGWLKRFDLSTSARQLKEEQFLAAGTGAFHRRIDDRALHFNAEKSFTFGLLDLLFGYQF